jgi:hypothetical protein
MTRGRIVTILELLDRDDGSAEEQYQKSVLTFVEQFRGRLLPFANGKINQRPSKYGRSEVQSWRPEKTSNSKPNAATASVPVEAQQTEILDLHSLQDVLRTFGRICHGMHLEMQRAERIICMLDGPGEEAALEMYGREAVAAVREHERSIRYHIAPQSKRPTDVTVRSSAPVVAPIADASAATEQITTVPEASGTSEAIVDELPPESFQEPEEKDPAWSLLDVEIRSLCSAVHPSFNIGLEQAVAILHLIETDPEEAIRKYNPNVLGIVEGFRGIVSQHDASVNPNHVASKKLRNARIFWTDRLDQHLMPKTPAVRRDDSRPEPSALPVAPAKEEVASLIPSGAEVQQYTQWSAAQILVFLDQVDRSHQQMPHGGIAEACRSAGVPRWKYEYWNRRRDALRAQVNNPVSSVESNDTRAADRPNSASESALISEDALGQYAAGAWSQAHRMCFLAILEREMAKGATVGDVAERYSVFKQYAYNWRHQHRKDQDHPDTVAVVDALRASNDVSDGSAPELRSHQVISQDAGPEEATVSQPQQEAPKNVLRFKNPRERFVYRLQKLMEAGEKLNDPTIMDLLKAVRSVAQRLFPGEMQADSEDASSAEKSTVEAESLPLSDRDLRFLDWAAKLSESCEPLKNLAQAEAVVAHAYASCVRESITRVTGESYDQPEYLKIAGEQALLEALRSFDPALGKNFRMVVAPPIVDDAVRAAYRDKPQANGGSAEA